MSTRAWCVLLSISECRDSLEDGFQQAENIILLLIVHDGDGSNIQKYHLFAGHIVLSNFDQPLVHVFIP